MRDLRIPAALLFTSSLFLVHCSSAEDPAANNSGSSGTASGSAGTTTGGAGKAGAGGGAGTGVAGTGGSMGGTSGATSGAGKGGMAGSNAGQSSGGAGTTGAGAGAGGRSMAGGAGMSAGGMAGTGAGMGGQSGSVGGMAGVVGVAGMGAGMGGKAGGGVGGSSGGAMTLTSTVITEGGMFPDLNTCAGDNKSPDLTWTAGPSGTMSYAVILLDTSNSLNHWALWDIPSSVTTLSAGLDGMAMPAMPSGAKQKAIQGNGYFGPCPSGADHLYKFTVYALPVASVTGAMTSEMTSAIAMDIMNANPLASASLSAHSTASMN